MIGQTSSHNRVPNQGLDKWGSPATLEAALKEAVERIRDVPGFLSEREACFLALAAACTPAEGVVLEIGSFKGRSTVALASVLARFQLGKLISVDPHSAPAVTDPDLGANGSSYDDLIFTLRAAGLLKQVEVKHTFSRELAKGWTQPIRLLWIDGDHTYAGTKEDFQLFRPYLSPGAIVALHDVLHEFEGPIRVFVEEVLPSDDFGPAGFWGSIGWAQYRPEEGSRFRTRKQELARRTSRLIPLVRLGKPRGFKKLFYKFWRSFIPHSPVASSAWADLIAVDRGKPSP